MIGGSEQESAWIGGRPGERRHARNDSPDPRRRRGRGSVTYEGRRAFIPAYGDFGAPTHIDRQGREYRRLRRPGLARGEGLAASQTLICRIPIRRRPPKARREGTPIGGGGAAGPGAPASRAGGAWEPKWPQIGERVALRNLDTLRLEYVHVAALFSMPNSATARLEVLP